MCILVSIAKQIFCLTMMLVMWSSLCQGLAGFHLENFIKGGSSVIIMKHGHDQMKSRCGFCSKLGYCEGVVKNLGGKLES